MNYVCLAIFLGTSFFVGLYLLNCSDVTTGGSSYEKVYFINLDESKDRATAMSQALAYYDLPYQRFSASNGYQVKLTRLINNQQLTGAMLKEYPYQHFSNEKFILHCSESLQVRHDNMTLSAGEIGCLCSHFRLWEDIVKNKYNAAIVMEDDAVLATDFREKLDGILKDIPQDYDILFLGIGLPFDFYSLFSYFKYKNVVKLNSRRIFHGMYGYIISQRGAQKLLNELNIMDWEVDLAISKIADKINTYSLKHLLIHHNYDIPSEIHKMGRAH